MHWATEVPQASRGSHPEDADLYQTWARADGLKWKVWTRNQSKLYCFFSCKYIDSRCTMTTQTITILCKLFQPRNVGIMRLCLLNLSEASHVLFCGEIQREQKKACCDTQECSRPMVGIHTWCFYSEVCCLGNCVWLQLSGFLPQTGWRIKRARKFDLSLFKWQHIRMSLHRLYISKIIQRVLDRDQSEKQTSKNRFVYSCVDCCLGKGLDGHFKVLYVHF